MCQYLLTHFSGYTYRTVHWHCWYDYNIDYNTYIDSQIQ